MDRGGYANDEGENIHEIKLKMDELILNVLIYQDSVNHVEVHRFLICLIILYFITPLQFCL